MIPCRASIATCARDCATSYGANRRSKASESLRRRKASCWGSANRDMGAVMLGSRAGAGMRGDGRTQRLRDAPDETLGHLREERKRDRARGDVLADRKLA